MSESTVHTWLRGRLQGGSASVGEIGDEARAQGFDWSAVSAAATSLGVEELCLFGGGRGKSDRKWRLPASSAKVWTVDDVAAATLRERERCVAILDSEHAAKQPAVARHYVREGTPADQAIRNLSFVPETTDTTNMSSPAAVSTPAINASEIFMRRRAEAGHK